MRSIVTYESNRHHLWSKWPPNRPTREPFLRQNLWFEIRQEPHPIILDCLGTDLPGPLSGARLLTSLDPWRVDLGPREGQNAPKKTRRQIWTEEWRKKGVRRESFSIRPDMRGNLPALVFLGGKQQKRMVAKCSVKRLRGIHRCSRALPGGKKGPASVLRSGQERPGLGIKKPAL